MSNVSLGVGYLDVMSIDGPDMLTGPATPRRRAFFLIFGGLAMVVAAWLVAPMAGGVIAVTAALYGWIAGGMMRQEPVPAPGAPSVATPVFSGLSEPVAVPGAPSMPAPAPAIKDANAILRHDLRGMLSPALMVSDRLMAHGDPAVRKAGEVIVKTVQRVTERLEETRTPAHEP